MNTKGVRPHGMTRVALVVELEVPREGPLNWVRTVTSRPGIAGTMSHVWSAQEGTLSSSQWDDIQASLLNQLSAVLLMAGGLVEGLDMT